MPNPLRAIADGLEVDGVPIMVYEDDMSGNVSNQWNVHYSVMWSMFGLPHKELEKMININFATTSPHASAMELMKAIADMITYVMHSSGLSSCLILHREAQKKPWKVWDCHRNRHVYVIPWLVFAAGDNPMQSEFCSHIGLNANQKCRVCKVGAPLKEMLTATGYLSLFEVRTQL